MKVLDHGSIEAVDFWGSDESIIEAARMSVQGGFKGWGPKQCGVCKGNWNPECQTCRGRGDVPGDEKLLAFLWKNKHETPFEMAGATFEVQAPIFVFREWHRHRVPFGYNEASARYAPLPDVNYIPTVERLMQAGTSNKQTQAMAPINKENAQIFREVCEREYTGLQKVYEDALANGIPKELARIILPVGRYSKMRATGNLRGWLSFLALRQAPNAQYEIREYANALHDLLADKFPRTLALFDEGHQK